jgi:hypothetical protein
MHYQNEFEGVTTFRNDTFVPMFLDEQNATLKQDAYNVCIYSRHTEVQ